MIICIPVTEDKGKQSPVSAHFGSAPIYLLVDTNTMACQAVPNTNQHLAHGGPLGGCKPVDSLDGCDIDAVAARTDRLIPTPIP